jgi:uncharacterized repeat protein (TIGR01451 family)
MKYQHQNPLITALLILSLLFSFTANAASPAAGTLIKNQASATYKDASGVEQFATSNLVETLIQHVAAMDLVQNQSRPGALGNTVYFPHVLTNNGNDIDSFVLTAVNNPSGDQYNFDAVKIYADANQDGVPDNTTEIATTGNLSAQEAFYFVVVTTLPAAGPAVGDQAQITVTGVSDFDNGVSNTNIDTVTVSDKAIIDVTKSMSASTGYSPSDVFTVTLSYTNNGVQAATGVTLLDALPTGMSYVAGSAKWSETGTTVLTDNDKTDSQSGMTYCAYHADCTSLPSNGDSTQQVTAIIASVATGDSGTLTFNVQIASNVAASTLHNQADYEYNNGSVVVTRIPSNKVPYEVLALPAVIANGSDTDSDPDNADNQSGTSDAFIVDSANQGETVAFNNIIRNKGNSTDTFDITIDASVTNPFPANTVFQLYQEDGFTPLLDTNSNGTVDTGPMVAGDKYTVVLKAVLPINATTGNNSGNGYNVTKTATSSIDTSVSDSVTDHLKTIVGASVDLTNNAAIGGAGVAGVGAGPEASPVTVVTAASGSNAVFNLFVNNTSSISSSYQLEYSMVNAFVAGNVDTNWQIHFYKDGGNGDCSTQGAILTSTGAIAANSNKQVCAVVSIPADATADKDSSGNPVEHSVYFRAISALTGVNDIKHDAVIIGDIPALSIEPDQQGQVQPGNTIIYSHRVSNNGNTALECINVSVTNNQTGWSSLIYQDVNEDGQLDSGDTLLTDQVLNVGESFPVLVKLFAPATAPMGTNNTSTLTVSGNQDDGDGNAATCNGAALTDEAIELTTVNQSEVSIKKEQSADNNCDGVSDSGVFTTTTFQVNPQACVVYRLTATNAGATAVNNVHIDDATPAFTVFHTVSGVTPSVTQGSISGGVSGTEGSITGGSTSGTPITLAPGERMVLTFGVQLD